MRQIYRFDAFVPPPLSEARLRRELERRRLRRQAALLVLGGLLTLFCIALAALSLDNPALVAVASLVSSKTATGVVSDCIIGIVLFRCRQGTDIRRTL